MVPSFRWFQCGVVRPRPVRTITRFGAPLASSLVLVLERPRTHASCPDFQMTPLVLRHNLRATAKEGDLRKWGDVVRFVIPELHSGDLNSWVNFGSPPEPPIEDNGSCRKSRRHDKKTSFMLSFPHPTAVRARERKAPSTQAGEYVRDRDAPGQKGNEGVKSRKQAIAIGLSKARQDGIKVRRKTRAV